LKTSVLRAITLVAPSTAALGPRYPNLNERLGTECSEEVAAGQTLKLPKFNVALWAGLDNLKRKVDGQGFFPVPLWVSPK